LYSIGITLLVCTGIKREEEEEEEEGFNAACTRSN
jgi:hypothetical protein